MWQESFVRCRLKHVQLVRRRRPLLKQYRCCVIPHSTMHRASYEIFSDTQRRSVIRGLRVCSDPRRPALRWQLDLNCSNRSLRLHLSPSRERSSVLTATAEALARRRRRSWLVWLASEALRALRKNGAVNGCRPGVACRSSRRAPRTGSCVAG